MADENQGGEVTIETLQAANHSLTEQLTAEQEARLSAENGLTQLALVLAVHGAKPDREDGAGFDDAVGAAIELIRQQSQRNEVLLAENAELRASLTATKGHATRAKGEVAVLREALSPTPRKVGRPRGLFGKPAEPYSPELAAIAIFGEENVEIVFSDGKAEITALAPITAYQHAWLQTGGRYMLREPIEVEGGDVEAEIAGFALLSNGEQVGWRELPDPVRVPKNGRVRLENCIVF